mmetsp:Transcript_42040/g.89772  ORF Transcript_42040/g.89772 Transcript_42040/m.89772 type:complete len:122 (-) Transcript_42040:196-561(-)
MGHEVDGFKFRLYAFEDFFVLVHHFDNATHFKSGKMIHFWSRVKFNPPIPAALPQNVDPLADDAPADDAPAIDSPVDLPAASLAAAQKPKARITRKMALSLIFVEFGCGRHGRILGMDWVQ